MIEIKRSSIVIHGYSREKSKKLENFLSIFKTMPNGYKIVDYTVYNYDEEKDIMIIPRGYNINRLKSILDDFSVIENKEHDISRNIFLDCHVQPRDDLQRDAIDFLIDEGKYSNNLYQSQRFLCLKTGKGKTYCMINAISKLKRRSIIIVDSLSTAEQWKNKFLEYTNIKEKSICMISGYDSIKKIMIDKSEPEYSIYIAMNQTLTSLIKKNPKLLTNFFTKIKVGIKVYDEAHVCWRAIFNIDAYTNTEKTYYLTATPGRSDIAENRLYCYCFETVPMYGRTLDFSYKYQSEKVSLKEAYHVAYYVKYNSKPNYNQQIEIKNKRSQQFDLNAYSDYIKNSSYDLFLFVILKLIDVCLSVKNDDRKIVIILIKNDLIQKLFEDLSQCYPEYQIGRFCGLIDKKEKDKELDKRIILSTEKSLGKAIDIKNLGFLINTVPFASSVISEQLLGRLRNNKKYSFLLDVADTGFEPCKRNQAIRASSYNKIVSKIREVEFNPTNDEIEKFISSKN